MKSTPSPSVGDAVVKLETHGVLSSCVPDELEPPQGTIGVHGLCGRAEDVLLHHLRAGHGALLEVVGTVHWPVLLHEVHVDHDHDLQLHPSARLFGNNAMA